MRQVARKGLITAMAASGMLAAAAGYAHADSGAQGHTAGSPGLLSGNLVQLPVNVPVNVCGNTVNVIGLLNPATGNSCANTSRGGSVGTRPSQPGGSSTHGGGSTAHGGTSGSPGVGSGSGVQLPIDLPVNISGNSVGVVGVGSPSTGNTSTNGSGPAPVTHRHPAAPGTVAHTPDDVIEAVPTAASLAHTGADGIGYAGAASAGMLLGGVLLYRRFRTGRS